jgi:hypothetical protein
MTPASKLPVTARAHTRIALRIQTALREMALGRAGVEEFRDLCDAVNMVEVLCDAGKLCRGGLGVAIHAAQEGMALAAADIRAAGHAGMRSAELEALRLLVCEYDRALARFSAETMERAGAEVVARIAAQHDNPRSDVRVVEA